MITKQVILISTVLSIWASLCDAQSAILTDLKDSDLARRAVCLYPSTLRMVNIARIDAFDEMISDVRKAVFFPMRKEQFGLKDLQRLRLQLEQEEGFEEYITMASDSQNSFMVLGRHAGRETAYLTQRNGSIYLGYMIGAINLAKLLELQRVVLDPESREENPFLDILFRQFEARKDSKEKEDTPLGEGENENPGDHDRTGNQ